MSLIFDPSDHLSFNQPSTKVSEAYLDLINENDSPVAFKIKTTAPKHYFVRPNSGTIKPTSSIKILIGLQPQKDISPDFKCKDKFLIQSTALANDFNEADIHNLWLQVESLDKSLIFEKKLKVKYVFADSHLSSASNDNNAEQTPASSNFNRDVTVFETPSNKNVFSKGPISPLAEADSIPANPFAANNDNTDSHAIENQSSKDPIPEISQKTADTNSYISSQSRSIDSEIKSSLKSHDPEVAKQTATSASNTSSKVLSNENNHHSESNSAVKKSPNSQETAKKTPAQTDFSTSTLKNSPSSIKKSNITTTHNLSSSGNVASHVEMNGISVPSVIFIAFASFLVGYLFF
ncbi:Vesicle-associated membrane protein-associated protein [Smittium culicis]|uniref:Vesicle-associated membrane protein-associated protein n=1 Tax=Smittium culicis TaxID=133412 RepID=A0A1R1YS13_9FUNG|nr:Vesicle-associated membrane protein-associated protein [Smittium culicis]